MSFGFSVGDFIAVGNLAWQVWKSCKAAPESFKNISHEVLSLHAVLKELEELLEDHTLATSKEPRLATITNGCHDVLWDLQTLVQKYESLGLQAKRTWDRLRWHSDDITELRARLTSNTVLLTAYMSTSQIVVERQLNKFIQEYRNGQHEPSVITTKTVDSLSMDEKQAWRDLRKELEDIGISLTAIDANKGFILDWFKEAISTGAFEEWSLDDDSSSKICADNHLNMTTSDGCNREDLVCPSKDATTLESNELEMQRAPMQSILTKPHQNTQIGPLQETTERTAKKFPNDTVQNNSKHHTQTEVLSSIVSPSSNLHTMADPEITSSTIKQPRPRRKRPLRIHRLISRIMHKDKELHNAISMGDEVTVKKLISDPAIDLECQNEDKLTPLSNALLKQNGAIVRLLLDARVEVEAEIDRIPLLVWAAGDGDENLVKLLLKKGTNANATDRMSRTPLIMAASHGHTSVATLLLEHGVNVNPQSGFQKSALHMAARHGNTDMANLLLKNGADVNFKSINGQRPLNEAAIEGHTRVAKLLLENGADVNLQGAWSDEPLLSAVKFGRADVVRLLIRHGADINIRNNQYQTLLYVSVSGEYTDRHTEVTRILLESGVNPKSGDITGQTPLLRAVDDARIDMARLLLEHGADPNSGDITGRTPLHSAAAHGQVNSAMLLLECGASVDAKNHSQETPLWLAARCGHEGVVQLLLDNSADLNACDSSNSTILSEAKKAGHKCIVRRLLYNGASTNAPTPLSLAANRTKFGGAETTSADKRIRR